MMNGDTSMSTYRQHFEIASSRSRDTILKIWEYVY